ncbi:uncharacterized protein [Triticum aestivum]|uniref:uncharacterized protein isoform X2 n=1 Tax=Triticum aestivum TaxID=4565 RepID=UPI001D022C2A|nr:uncharacterized protein LOC123101293 isoform X2 [Triticum aestivum]
MAAIRCAAAGIALLRRAAAGGERAALQKIFPSLRPRGIHSLLDRTPSAGALSSPMSLIGPARCGASSNRYMSTGRLQKGGHSAPTYQEPSAKLLCLLTLTASLMHDAWDSYDGFACRFGEFSTCEFSLPQISQFPTAAWSVLDKTRDSMLEREPPSST